MAQLNVEAMPMSVQCVSNHCTELPLTLNTAHSLLGLSSEALSHFKRRLEARSQDLVSRGAKPECAKKKN